MSHESGKFDGSKAWYIAEDVLAELLSATKTNGVFHSYHEGWAIIKEEMDELWEEVRKRDPDKERMRKEATQVAAMAIRFIHDLTSD